jgi:phosphatidylglycerophosphatase C
MGTPPSRRQFGNRVIVAFDFDGTLTTHDSFTAFLLWKAEPLRYFLGLVRLLPHILAYALNRDRGRLKAAACTRFLGGLSDAGLASAAAAFAKDRGRALLRPDALQVWNAWRRRRAVMVIVTASPEAIVAPFARRLGADLLIGTRLERDASGRLTGALDGANCRGPEKVARLRAVFGPDLALAAAYGDTSGDRDMLAIAAIKGYRVFTGRP